MKATNQRVTEHVRVMISEGRRLTTGTVARHAGVSDTTAYTTLLALVEGGQIEHVGAGRGAHFRPVQPSLVRISEKREGMSEDEVWKRVVLVPAIRELKPNVQAVTRHAFTEMVNNAIDHSGGSTVTMTFFKKDGRVGFEVLDDGIGIFENVMTKFALKTPLEAVAELQKGKVTSLPDLHAGEGIFFTSKMGDFMTVESHANCWIIDNVQPDNMAVVRADPGTSGTRVRFELSEDSDRTTVDTYRPFTDDDHAWTKTRTVIRLFREGNQIVSRSEAKRLLLGLDKWREVELDFRGIEGVGQGFADEVFRVWANANPNTKLIATNMIEPVAFMIARSRSSGNVIVTPATARLDITRQVTPIVTVDMTSAANTTMTTNGAHDTTPDSQLTLLPQDDASAKP